MEDALENVKSDLSAEAYLEIQEKSSLIPKVLFEAADKKRKTGNHEHTYKDCIKNFALSLHLKSASAYRYVRSCFESALPSESTIRRWCSKIDASPGFNKLALDYLRVKSLEFDRTGKKLLCSFTLDEMALKKHMQFTGIYIYIYKVKISAWVFVFLDV